MKKRILLLGSGELGKEFVIAAQRLGQEVIAVDCYDNAPAMQVADYREVIDMLDGDQLDLVVQKYLPDYIVPEIEAIRTSRLYDYEKRGITVVPSAKAVNYTMNRKQIRDLAAKDLGLKTANYLYATSLKELEEAVLHVGMPCVVKPLMSSSGKGQSTIKSIDDMSNAWYNAQEKGRGDATEVIVEAFVPFVYEFTLLTVTQEEAPTLFCPPIGHRQANGDYQESWQPVAMSEEVLCKAKEMAQKVTTSLEGNGLWGVEFFVTADDVIFSELSPRPHDTGMVTLGNTQNLNEFELHCRAILGLPITEVRLEKKGASAVVLAPIESNRFLFEGIECAMMDSYSDLRIFGKEDARIGRRMAVALAWENNKEEPLEDIIERAKKCSQSIVLKEI
ncbi:formate-dependent phosphoribosylglycinamide formyltransferase [Halosquirtibacter xylanolyticus]|uniref:formate-dependent phosphoribosylglycinamide formyltransferase n=1 Tax=Halosquirtibacter xylanolyticus TaxID=3374599 RepID=UPI003749BC49|nr:formate-dependent phosphoribosylglycinamide formyltransferase [Prolixibacteraceae bacterium]